MGWLLGIGSALIVLVAAAARVLWLLGKTLDALDQKAEAEDF